MAMACKKLHSGDSSSDPNDTTGIIELGAASVQAVSVLHHTKESILLQQNLLGSYCFAIF
jgi:hypothetical protein